MNVLRVEIKNFSVESEDGFKYSLTKRFFYLYVYLALERIENTFDNNGFVEREELVTLPYWEKNDILSVGKQISRHMNQMEREGRNIIEAAQKVNGPYRLKIDPSSINFDISLSKVKSFLGLNSMMVASIPKDDPSFYKYIENTYKGAIAINKGRLKRALTYFQQAYEEGRTAEHKIHSLLKIGKILERQGEYKKALNSYKKVVSLIKKGGMHNNLDLAKTYSSLAWLYRSQRDFKLAEKNYHRALEVIRGKQHYQVLGDINNGLGLVQMAYKKYEEAIGFFQKALDCRCMSSDFYGISAAYFNIGTVYQRWADEYVKRQKDTNKVINDAFVRNNYKKAIELAIKCKDICISAAVGNDTSQDRILAAHCYLQLGELKDALEYAKEAYDMATNSGTKRDIADSAKNLGKIYLKMNEEAKAKGFLKESSKAYRAIGYSDQVTKLKDRYDILD